MIEMGEDELERLFYDMPVLYFQCSAETIINNCPLKRR